MEVAVQPRLEQTRGSSRFCGENFRDEFACKLLAWISKDLEFEGEECEVEGFFEILLKYSNCVNSRNAFEIIFGRWIMLFVGYWNLFFFQYSMLYMRKYSYEDIIVEIEEISSYTCKRLLIKVSVFKILILTILYSYFEIIIIIMYLTRNFTVKYFFNLSNSK